MALTSSCGCRRVLVGLLVAVVVQSATSETAYSSLNEDAQPLEALAAQASHKWSVSNEALKKAYRAGASRDELARLTANSQRLEENAKRAQSDAFDEGSSLTSSLTRQVGLRLGGSVDSESLDRVDQPALKLKKASGLEKAARQKELRARELNRQSLTDAKALSTAASGGEKDALKVAIADKQAKVKEIDDSVQAEQIDAIKLRESAQVDKATQESAKVEKAATKGAAASEAKRTSAQVAADSVAKLEQKVKKSVSDDSDDKDDLQKELAVAKGDQLKTDTAALKADEKTAALATQAQVAKLETVIKSAKAKLHASKESVTKEDTASRDNLKAKVKLIEVEAKADVDTKSQQVKQLAKDAKTAGERGDSDAADLENKARKTATKIDQSKTKTDAKVEKVQHKAKKAHAARSAEAAKKQAQLHKVIKDTEASIEAVKLEATRAAEAAKQSALQHKIRTASSKSSTLKAKVKELKGKKASGATVSAAQLAADAANGALADATKQMSANTPNPELFEKNAKTEANRVLHGAASETSAKKQAEAAAVRMKFDQARAKEFEATSNQRELGEKMEEATKKSRDYEKESTMQAAEVSLSKTALAEKQTELERMEASEKDSKTKLKTWGNKDKAAEVGHKKARKAEEAAKKILLADGNEEETAIQNAKNSNEMAAKTGADYDEAKQKALIHKTKVQERKSKEMARAQKAAADLEAQKQRTEEAAAKMSAEKKAKKVSLEASKEADQKNAEAVAAREKFSKLGKEVKIKGTEANDAVAVAANRHKESNNKNFKELEMKKQPRLEISGAAAEMCSADSCSCPSASVYRKRVNANEPCEHALIAATDCCKDLCSTQTDWKLAGCVLDNNSIEKLVSGSMKHAAAAEKATATLDSTGDQIAELEAKLSAAGKGDASSELHAKITESKSTAQVLKQQANSEGALARALTKRSIEERNARAAAQVTLINKTTDKQKLKEYLKDNIQQEAKLKADVETLKITRKLEEKRQRQEKAAVVDVKAVQKEKQAERKMTKVKVLKMEAKVEERKAETKIQESRELIVKASAQKKLSKESITKAHVKKASTGSLMRMLKEHMTKGTHLQGRISKLAIKKEIVAMQPETEKVISLQAELAASPDPTRLKQILAETSQAASSLKDEITAKVKTELKKRLESTVTAVELKRANTPEALKDLLDQNAEHAKITQASIADKLKRVQMAHLSTDELAKLFHETQMASRLVDKRLTTLHKSAKSKKEKMVHAAVLSKVQRLAGDKARIAVQNALNAKKKGLSPSLAAKAMRGKAAAKVAKAIKLSAQKIKRKFAKDQAAVQVVREVAGVKQAANIQAKIDEKDAKGDKVTQEVVKVLKIKAHATAKFKAEDKKVEQIRKKLGLKHDTSEKGIGALVASMKHTNKAAVKNAAKVDAVTSKPAKKANLDDLVASMKHSNKDAVKTAAKVDALTSKPAKKADSDDDESEISADEESKTDSDDDASDKGTGDKDDSSVDYIS